MTDRSAAPERLVDGVLFDIDDTLVDTRGAFAVALADVARRWLPDVTPDRDHELVTTWRADVGGHYARYTRGEVDYHAQRRARANELHARYGGPALDEDGYRAWSEVFDDGFRGAWAAHVDVEAVVDDLLAAGLAVGALSNASVALQTDKLRRVGLVDRVPMLVGVDTLGFGKPDPRVFVEACRLLGTSPARTAYVGDELDVDAAAARAAGLVGVWLDRPGPRRVPVPDEDVATARAAGVRVIGSLADLPGALGLRAGR
ncbi:HAD family hydrolase [Cellulomonas fimi]|uniref:HAD-superfamily hydrolase, subfamily IA, variant 3 n=1 Tax=Cellulomonas fimi (strain ATCC 484 / DSM 20113 / JCM 1341 / CCUG 24087 / LMG 16345 / NBRC 15513 / NCIMB 8980 / NCTC 7547 / NRS-133) TaxID=590998 RepID=F4H6N3_CELFA|nr:HAD family hydrolase [Cellulomonas fimi]AEE46794.1 HAD-superfamily hydrolase, subfamily IA, variant 3 [Cellulomonas fimi ATCC 484]NNH09120.1 HAD family hydrolase [Cellulomonas fimi]VEH34205.1 phosphoglycolate phosphatase [Cellulomonas fimi]